MRAQDLQPCRCCGRGVAAGGKPNFFEVTIAEFVFAPASGFDPVPLGPPRAAHVCATCSDVLEQTIAELAKRFAPGGAARPLP